jgi:hypothetical protein
LQSETKPLSEATSANKGNVNEIIDQIDRRIESAKGKFLSAELQEVRKPKDFAFEQKALI